MEEWPEWCSLQQVLLYTVERRPPVSDDLHQAVASVYTLPPAPFELVLIFRAGHIRGVGDLVTSPMDSEDIRVSDGGCDIPPDSWVADKIDWRNSRLSLPPGLFSNREFRNIKFRTKGLLEELEQRITRPSQKPSPAKLKTGPKFDYDGKFWTEVVVLANSLDGLPDTLEKGASVIAERIDDARGMTVIRDKLRPIYLHPDFKRRG